MQEHIPESILVEIGPVVGSAKSLEDRQSETQRKISVQKCQCYSYQIKMYLYG